jgi:hypothetical protein
MKYVDSETHYLLELKRSELNIIKYSLKHYKEVFDCGEEEKEIIDCLVNDIDELFRNVP